MSCMVLDSSDNVAEEKAGSTSNTKFIQQQNVAGYMKTSSKHNYRHYGFYKILLF